MSNNGENMKSRDEVLREFGVGPRFGLGRMTPNEVEIAMADRIRELEAASGEPVAWAIYDSDGYLASLISKHDRALRTCVDGDRIVPLYSAPPSAAGVTVTEAMVEAAAKALRDGFRSAHANEEGHNVWRGLADIAVRAALTAAT